MTSERSIARDDSGAMVVIGLFFAVMVSGFLYYLIGIGEAIVYRETMQDASDAGAFSAAVVHARGMNILVLINLIMAALLAVLVALKLIQTLIIAAIVVCGALAFVTFGATLAAIPPLQNAQNAVGRVHDQLKPVVFNLLRVGHRTAGVVRVAMPPSATVRAYDVVMDDAFAPAPRFGFTWPIGIGRTLPTEDGEYEVLCHRAGAVVGDVVALPFTQIHPRIGGWVSRRTAGLVSTFMSWFCSGQGSPDFSFELDVAIPETTSPAIERCQRDDRTEADCNQAELDQQTSHPSESARPYDCPQRSDGTDEPLCAQRTAQARVVCAPGAGRRFDYVYQEARMRRWFWRERVGTDEPPQYRIRHTGDALSSADDPAQQDELVSARRRESPMSPCAPFGPGSVGAQGWNTRDLQDLCGRESPEWPSSVFPPAELPIGRAAAVSEEWTMIRRLFACHESRSESAPVDGERDTPSDTSDMTPQRMRAQESDGDPIELGEDPFQVRMIVLGHPPGEQAERGVELANWGHDVAADEGSMLSVIRRLGEYSVAQAEFFYPSTDLRDREDWLWNMRWRARMRRFVVPIGDDGSESCRGAGNAGSGTCAQTSGVVGFLRNSVVH
ncbi:MAG: hypothetical protein M3Y87_05695 [Myxococcota bacterium]|nr:hypothetical protein [Myxococcota bacterium]